MLEIKVGQSRLVMKKDGSVFVNGKTIKLDGTSELQAQAMKMTVKGKMTTEVSGMKTSVKGTMVEVKADAIAQINGALVKVG